MLAPLENIRGGTTPSLQSLFSGCQTRMYWTATGCRLQGIQYESPEPLGEYS